MKLHDLLDPIELEDMIEQGFVRWQTHPDYPSYVILNYSDKAVIFHVWNNVTRQCRGLIYNATTYEVIARPFPKFFNYGEKESRTYDENEEVTVTDKMDGSLGILYRLPDGGHAIATRGSFSSEQAIHATEVWNQKYADTWIPLKRETVLFEIIYPQNRIVVDYGDQDDLVLLGLVDVETGETFSPQALDWDGPKAEVFEYASLSDALAAPDRPGREGMVVHFRESDTRVKLKQQDYLRLHKIVSNMNEHVVWEHMKNPDNNADVRPLLEGLPDEFHPWVEEVAFQLYRDYLNLAIEIEERFYELEALDLTSGPRKDFALAVKDLRPVVKASLFKALDGQSDFGLIWKSLEPGKDNKMTKGMP